MCKQSDRGDEYLNNGQGFNQTPTYLQYLWKDFAHNIIFLKLKENILK